MLLNPNNRLMRSGIMLLMAVVLTGCSTLFGGGPEATATPDQRALVPTFTPTPVIEAAPAQEVAAPAQEVAAPVEAAPAAEEATPTPEPEPTATPAPVPAFVITQDIVNVRQGPGTTYGLVGSAATGTQLAITGKNDAGDWWQICCVNGEPGWVFGQLGTASNTESVEVAQNIPPAPAPEPVAVPPTPEPAPPQEAAPAPQPQENADAGPCGGDDGCKFKLRGGPSTGGNGGTELKMQFLFVHGGRGDEAQGSYFVVLKKDGVRLPVGDNVRSLAKTKTPGQLGDYNYEYKLGLDTLPGNTVAGNYSIWVLDGNGERDSDVFNFNIDNGQNGLLWIKFDQS